MENNLLISVIIPNFNHSNYLSARIESVLEQSYQNIEIILLDDMSSDGSKEVLTNFESNTKVKHLVYNQKNSGSPFKQWVKGINLAQGDFVWIAESDDLASNEFLESLVKEIDRNTNLVFCPIQHIDQNGNISVQDRKQCFSKIVSTKEFINNHLIGKNDIITGSSVLFRREASISYLDKLSTFRYRGDLFLWLSILQLGDVKLVNKTLCLYRVHANNQTAKNTLNSQLIKIRESFVIVDQLTRFGYDVKSLSGVFKFNVRRLSKAKHNYLKIPLMFLAAVPIRCWKNVIKDL